MNGEGFSHCTLEYAPGNDGTKPSPKSTGEDSARAQFPCPPVFLEPQAPRWHDCLKRIETTEFLDLLFRNAAPNSFLELRLAPQAKGGQLLRHAFCSPLGQPRDAELGFLLGVNCRVQSSLFFSVNPRFRLGGKAADVTEALALGFDLDEDSDAQWGRVAQLSAQIPIFAISSSGTKGHGHVFLRLERPETRFELVEIVHRRLEHFLGAGPTNTLAHCWRLPGSFNWKTGSSVRTGVWACRTAQTTLEELDRALDALGVPKVEPQPSKGTFSLQPVGPVDQDRLLALWELLPAWARDLIQRGKQPGDGYRSRSEADPAAVRALVNAGASDAEIKFVFTTSPIGEKYRECGDAYLARTLDFVRKTATYSYARVLGIDRGLSLGRVVLRLDVVAGAESGAVFRHGVQTNSSVWQWVLRSAGLPATPPAVSPEPERLVGTILRVELETIQWKNKPRLQVKHFLPPLPSTEEGEDGDP